MTKPRIKINQGALDKVIAEATQREQAKLTGRLQLVIRGVRDEMTGQPADEVYAVLVDRIRTDVSPDITIDEDNLRRTAQEIEAGSLEG